MHLSRSVGTELVEQLVQQRFDFPFSLTREGDPPVIATGAHLGIIARHLCADTGFPVAKRATDYSPFLIET